MPIDEPSASSEAPSKARPADGAETRFGFPERDGLRAFEDAATDRSTAMLELRGLTILLVDDDRDSLEVTAYLLENAGAQVTMASTGAEALMALELGSFDLAVSDLGLPDQDGLELIRAIRARGYDAERLPAIAVTGFVGIIDERLVQAAGFQRHLSKPVDVTTLLQCAAALGHRQP